MIHLSSQRPKVLWLFRDLNHGGMQNVAIRLMPHLSSPNSVVVSLERGGQLTSAIQLRIDYLSLPTSRSRFLRLVHYTELIWQIAQIINKEKPDIVMLFGHSIVLLGALSRLAVAVECMFVANIRNSFEEFKHTDRPKLDFVHLFTYLALKRMDKVLPVTQAIATQCIEMGVSPNRVHVVYNGVNITEIKRQAQQPVDHPWCQENVPILINIGRLNDQKNQTLLLHAISQLNQHTPVRLWLVGDGENKTKLIALTKQLGIEKNIEFLGFQENPYKYIAQSDIFVLSSNYEGFPNVLIEAMAVGIPIISTNCPTGPDEIITDGESGILVPINNADVIAEAVMKILANSNLSEKMYLLSSKGSEKFSWENTVQTFQQALDIPPII